jgi:hypothetical protein
VVSQAVGQWEAFPAAGLQELARAPVASLVVKPEWVARAEQMATMA